MDILNKGIGVVSGAVKTGLEAGTKLVDNVADQTGKARKSRSRKGRKSRTMKRKGHKSRTMKRKGRKSRK